MAEDWQIDAQLLDAWRGGDQRAGAKLYDRHSDAVTRFFENKVQTDAEDLIQQTFLKLVRGRDAIREGSTLRAYLLRTAHRVLLDRLRSARRRPGDAQPVDLEDVSIAELAPGLSTMVAKREEQRLVLEALRAIPVHHQIALELHYWEGLSAAEIAAIVGVSHSAMRSRMAKARALLLEQLERLASSGALLESTIGGLEQWAHGIRESLGRPRK